MKKRNEIVFDYIETQKMIYILKNSSSFAYFQTLINLNKISKFLYNLLAIKQKDIFEIQILNRQICKLYINNTQIIEKNEKYKEKMSKIKEAAIIYLSKYNIA